MAKKSPEKPEVVLSKETVAALKELATLDEEAKARGKKQLMEAIANEKAIESHRKAIAEADSLSDEEYLKRQREP